MYIVDGICYADGYFTEDTITLNSVNVLDDLYLIANFTNGEARILDLSEFMKYPAYQPLKDRNIFNTAAVDHGLLLWLDGEIDMSSDTVYSHSIPYNADEELIA